MTRGEGRLRKLLSILAPLRLNIICVVGSALAVLTLLMPWVNLAIPRAGLDTGDTVSNVGATPLSMIRGLDFSLVLRLSAAFFVIGTLASFVTPLGGFIQLSAFVLLTADALIGMPPGTHFSAGVAASFASMVLVVLGFLLPLGFSENSRPSRILTVSRISRQHCINMIPLIGAVLGIGSLFASWASITDLPSHLTFAASGIDYILPGNSPKLSLGLGDGMVRISVALFLGGCVGGVITPLGGAPQLLGCTLYYYGKSVV